jgi:protein TonB
MRPLLLTLCLAAAPAAASSWTSCLDPGIEPPAPVEREAPPYPESARLANAEGSVEVAFTVLRTGGVGWVRIVRAEPSGFFEQAALDGVRAWRFTPALRDGAPIECRIRTRVRFTLADVATVRAGGTDPDGLPAPGYPPDAREARLEGHVEVTLAVAPDGRVTRAEVTSAMPRGSFERATLAAVKSWRLPPAAEPRELRRRFDFSLPDSPPRPPAATMIAAGPLPPEACDERIAGWVRLEVDTDPQGRILAARVVAAQPAGLFDTVAVSIARRSRVAPAWRDGHPVAATGLLTLTFDPATGSCPDAVPPDGRSPARRAPAPRVSGAPATNRGPSATDADRLAGPPG